MAHAPPEIKTPAGVQPAGEMRENESVAASDNLNSTFSRFPQTKTQRRNPPLDAGNSGNLAEVSDIRIITFGCFDAIPRQKRTPAAVRGKLGVKVRTVGDFAEVPRAIHSTTLRPRVARAYVVHKNLLVETLHG
jgi:hypothetical protein